MNQATDVQKTSPSPPSTSSSGRSSTTNHWISRRQSVRYNKHRKRSTERPTTTEGPKTTQAPWIGHELYNANSKDVICEQRGYQYHTNTSKSYVYYTTVIKSHFEENGTLQYIMETKIESKHGITKYFHMFINNGTLSWVWETINDTIQYNCIGLATEEINLTWILLIVRFDMYNFKNYNGMVNTSIKFKKLDKNTTVDQFPKWVKCIENGNDSRSFDIEQQQEQRRKGRISPDKQKDLSIRLGRGFRGEMAYGSVFFSTLSDDMFDHMITSGLPNEIPENAFVQFGLRWDSDLMPCNNSRSNIRKDLETEIATKYYTNITCGDTSVIIEVVPAPFKIQIPKYNRRTYNRFTYSYYWDYPMNITLGNINKNCNFSWDDERDRFTITENLNSCGFKRSKNDNGDIVYKNKVDVSSNLSTTHLMDVSCLYEHMSTVYKDVNIEAFAVEDENNIQLDGNAPQPQLNFTLTLYSDFQFSVKLNNPVKVSDKDILHVEAIVHSTADDIQVCSFVIKISNFINLLTNSISQLYARIAYQYRVLTLQLQLCLYCTIIQIEGNFEYLSH